MKLNILTFMLMILFVPLCFAADVNYISSTPSDADLLNTNTFCVYTESSQTGSFLNSTIFVFNESQNEIVNYSYSNSSCFTQSSGIYYYTAKHVYNESTDTIKTYYSATQSIGLNVNLEFDFTNLTLKNDSLTDDQETLIDLNSNVIDEMVDFIAYRYDILNCKSSKCSGQEIKNSISSINHIVLLQKGESINVTGVLKLNNGSTRYLTNERYIHRSGVDFTNYTLENNSNTIREEVFVGIKTNIPSINVTRLGYSYIIYNDTDVVKTKLEDDNLVFEMNGTILLKVGETLNVTGFLETTNGSTYLTEQHYIRRVPLEFDYTSYTLANNSNTTKNKTTIYVETNALSEDVNRSCIWYNVTNNGLNIANNQRCDSSVSLFSHDFNLLDGDRLETIGILELYNGTKFFTESRYVYKIASFPITFNMNEYANNETELNIDQSLTDMQCSFDNVNFVDCENESLLSNLTGFSSLGEGIFALYVNGTWFGEYYEGNISLTKDTIFPNVTINSVSTTDTTPDLSGTIDDNNASINLTINSQTYTVVNNADGTWSLLGTNITALSVGTYDVNITVTDLAGNSKMTEFVSSVIINQQTTTGGGGGGNNNNNNVEPALVVDEDDDNPPLIDYRELYANRDNNQNQNQEETDDEDLDSEANNQEDSQNETAQGNAITGAVIGENFIGSGNFWTALLVVLAIVGIWLIFFILAKRRKKDNN